MDTTFSDGVERIRDFAQRVRSNVARVIVGKDAAIDLVLVAVLCDGHALLEDVPGTGKTMLAKSVARSLDCTFRRIQFTPDLLPSDITGLYFFNQKRQEFDFHPGPVFAQVVLADEINRATPRTQSAMLECMEERQVSLEGETLALPRPFLVLATQNPVELEGTFPLPEAQIDRFLVRIPLGYPSENEEKAIMRRFRADNPLETLDPIASADGLTTLQTLCREVYVSAALEDYIVAIARASRVHPAVELGASPRATLALYHAVQALAAIRGRGFVIPDDIKQLISPVLGHRLILSSQTRLRAKLLDDVLEDLIRSVPVPVEDEGSVLSVTPTE